jgi:hypothetical protein
MNLTEPLLVFTQEEIDLIGRTADAMSAYMGKPVLAEIMDADDTGAEWVAFGVPLGVDEDIDEDSSVIIQLGGRGARYAGNRGGMAVDDDAYSCECLWIIQLSDDDEGRYLKVDPLSQEYAASNDLAELLPFAVIDEPLPTDEDDEADEGNPNVAEDDDAETRRMDQILDDALPPSRRLH